MARRGRSTHRNTEGRRLLGQYLKTTTQSALANELDLGQQTISAWKSGRARPEPHHREALQRIAGIPVASWYSADELAVARGDAAHA